MTGRMGVSAIFKIGSAKNKIGSAKNEIGTVTGKRKKNTHTKGDQKWLN